MATGTLNIHITTKDEAIPISGITVLVGTLDGNILFKLLTDINGHTKTVDLWAPSKMTSIVPYTNQSRCSFYKVEVLPSEKYQKVIIWNVEIFDGVDSILPINISARIIGETEEFNTKQVVIPTIHGVDFEQKGVMSFPYIDLDQDTFATSLESVTAASANEVGIPEYITVHLGRPNASATNVRVPFKEYIKNVASSEIFPTWEREALYANILCQISFALNRVFTVWYKSRGLDFDITNNTAFDQYFVYERNIFQNISEIVDEIFNNFLRVEGRREPFFAQYCNGTTSTCDGLSQWGSQELALNNYTAMQIIKYYYSDSVQLVYSNNFEANHGIYPGTPLKLGSTGDDVFIIQFYLNRISGTYYIPSVGIPTGVFDNNTVAAVEEFQRIFYLIDDGIVGKKTWYQIIRIYVAITRLAELDSEGERISIGKTPPTLILSLGDRGPYVIELQFLLNFISVSFPVIPFTVQNNIYGQDTKRSVTEFQKNFDLKIDGIVGPQTWDKLYIVYWSIKEADEPY